MSSSSACKAATGEATEPQLQSRRGRCGFSRTNVRVSRPSATLVSFSMRAPTEGATISSLETREKLSNPVDTAKLWRSRCASTPVRCSEVDPDRSLHFDWLTIQQVRTVTPLADGFDGGPGQDVRSADHYHVPNPSVFGDGNVQNNGTSHSTCESDLGISGLNLVLENSHLDALGNRGSKFRNSVWRSK